MGIMTDITGMMSIADAVLVVDGDVCAGITVDWVG